MNTPPQPPTMAMQTMATAVAVDTYDQGNDGPPWPTMTMDQTAAIEARKHPHTTPPARRR